MNAGITAINEEVKHSSAFVQPLLGEMSKVVIGQKKHSLNDLLLAY
jgi:hypothetical protein